MSRQETLTGQLFTALENNQFDEAMEIINRGVVEEETQIPDIPILQR